MDQSQGKRRRRGGSTDLQQQQQHQQQQQQQQRLCSHCGRGFKRSEHLERHVRTHTKEKPYICHCGSAFSRRDLLTRHQRISHEAASSTSPDAPPSDEIQHAAADSDRSVASDTTPLSDVSIQHWIPQPRYLDQAQVMADNHYATSPPAYHHHISGHEFFGNAPNMPGFNDFKDINNFVDHGSMSMQWNSYQYEPGMEQDFVDPALQGFIADPSPYIVHAHHHPETYNH
ncbi:hypothetical protein DL768_001780 [Monosporascus sp. mg162]|nr:hypothetical protein DL768_001780 [Monosporascus sp. mg162]